MIQARFTTFEFAPDGNNWVEVPVAQLVAAGDEVTISGPHADWISPDISIVDPDTGERVSRSQDAERWARLLPFAYRSGDIAVEVAEVAATEPTRATPHRVARS